MTTINFLRYNRACVALDIRLGSWLRLLLSLSGDFGRGSKKTNLHLATGSLTLRSDLDHCQH